MSEVLPYKDRRAGLAFFGVLQILAGFFICALLVILFIGFAESEKNGVAVGLDMQLLAAGSLGVWAAILLWLGIGSICKRRWARALSLILAWSALLVGLLLVVALMPLLPDLCALLPSSLGVTPLEAGIAVSAVQFLVLILIPLIGVLFYDSPQVKATCEAHSPVAWTDKCPLPVLAAGLYVISACVLLLWILVIRALDLAVMPPQHELMLMAILLVGIALYLFSGWKMCRLAVIGWWIQFTVTIIGIAYVVTGLLHLNGFLLTPPDHVAGVSLVTQYWFVLVVSVLWLGYLLLIKRFFNREQLAVDDVD